MFFDKFNFRTLKHEPYNVAGKLEELGRYFCGGGDLLVVFSAISESITSVLKVENLEPPSFQVINIHEKGGSFCTPEQGIYPVASLFCDSSVRNSEMS